MSGHRQSEALLGALVVSTMLIIKIAVVLLLLGVI